LLRVAIYAGQFAPWQADLQCLIPTASISKTAQKQQHVSGMSRQGGPLFHARPPRLSPVKRDDGAQVRDKKFRPRKYISNFNKLLDFRNV